MLEVRHECRPDFDEEGLQIRVLSAGDQGLVDGVDHLLVVGDFVLDVRLVERCTFERLEMSNVLVASGGGSGWWDCPQA